MEDTIVVSCVKPDAIPLRLDAWPLDHTATLLTLHVTSTQRDGPCPICTGLAHRLHSRYARRLADLPWGAARVRWQLHVRKVCGGNASCPRRLFTEQLPGVGAPWARRTPRLAGGLIAIGLARGGGPPPEPTLGPHGQPPDPPARGPSPAAPMRQQTTGLRR